MNAAEQLLLLIFIDLLFLSCLIYTFFINKQKVTLNLRQKIGWYILTGGFILILFGLIFYVINNEITFLSIVASIPIIWIGGGVSSDKPLTFFLRLLLWTILVPVALGTVFILVTATPNMTSLGFGTGILFFAILPALLLSVIYSMTTVWNVVNK